MGKAALFHYRTSQSEDLPLEKSDRADYLQAADCSVLSVRVLELKTCLLKAVEELHIHRDAESRHEQQINKLVLEKQELEWNKESLQSKIETMTSQHSEAVASVKNKFQARIKEIEEEKGKYQLAAELNNKGVNSLKEELKLLRLEKYSLEKKLSELEQKLHLQNQAKDSHLNKLGEVEKRFGIVSKRCASLLQAHVKLEQNVTEAIQLNKRLTIVNKNQTLEKQALTQDVERLNRELISAQVSSVSQSGQKSIPLQEREQQIEQLRLKLHAEVEVSSILQRRIDDAQAEKQELMSSLQCAQQLLHVQTRAASVARAQLHSLAEEYQALKREHEMIQEESKGKEARFGNLMEEFKKGQMKWEKEGSQMEQPADGISVTDLGTDTLEMWGKTVSLEEETSLVSPVEDRKDTEPAFDNCSFPAEEQDLLMDECLSAQFTNACRPLRIRELCSSMEPSGRSIPDAMPQSDYNLIPHLRPAPMTSGLSCSIAEQSSDLVLSSFSVESLSRAPQNYRVDSIEGISWSGTSSVHRLGHDPAMDQTTCVLEAEQHQTSIKPPDVPKDRSREHQAHGIIHTQQGSYIVTHNGSEGMQIDKNGFEDVPAPTQNSECLDRLQQALHPDWQRDTNLPHPRNIYTGMTSGELVGSEKVQVRTVCTNAMEEMASVDSVASCEVLSNNYSHDVSVNSQTDQQINSPEPLNSSTATLEYDSSDDQGTVLKPSITEENMLIIQQDHAEALDVDSSPAKFLSQVIATDTKHETCHSRQEARAEDDKKPICEGAHFITPLHHSLTRHRSCFELCGFTKDKRTSTCRKENRKCAVAAGYPEIYPAAIMSTADMTHSSSVHLSCIKDQQQDRNAIKQTLAEVSLDKEGSVPVSLSSSVTAAPARSHVGPPPRSHSPRGPCSAGRAAADSQSHAEPRDSTIQSQIAKIEQFLNAEGLSIPKKGKTIEKLTP
ncbi:coiled-coil domain-containing protein 73 [Denticeps clupeoides]|uniref:coiled-coil domain-containing protein 73 n=1 Tax=Denticeps clupeoides TaxID=299321 RepID=UPI0010A42D64|nr:coiled-coil domain-containing protein 73 [Denticeps clupeoides]